MEFRPCIDIHDGKVKQIVGGSISEGRGALRENYVSDKDAAYYASLYREKGLKNAHVINLNKKGSEEYFSSLKEIKSALHAFPQGLQVGGGIDDDNALEILESGASHVIVTSFIFDDGEFRKGNLKKLQEIAGRKRLVLDLSCRKRDDKYFVVTNRWQRFTSMEISRQTLELLAEECDEFLIHAVDVEGKLSGIDTGLLSILAQFKGIPVTYAGGVHDYRDIETVKEAGRGRINVTVGSALSIFGGSLDIETIERIIEKE
ncbi:MAG: phosphoribosylformimino-5-aminoimidazole carboxamide ribotide isomerase [Lachnospiraceae bacterium]|nr:phosphoribosylformimino-5-aminoimidazole carboxamide ribotide isomerase [Lachnospiraceae bacterium]